MGALENRLSHVEAKVEEHSKLEQRTDRRFDQVDRRFDQIDRRFDQVDRRFDQIDRRFDHVDRRFDQTEKSLGNMRDLIAALDEKVDRRFMWVVGIQFATLIAIIAGMFGIVTRLI